MTKDELLEVIEQAARENATELNLSRHRLTALPLEIAQLTDLLELNLSFNSLTTLPAEIAQLSKLKRLNLSSNQLTKLPAEIAQLSKLKRLNLSSNQLTKLPAEIAQLSNLIELDLNGNRLTALPLEITQLSKLIELYLRENNLTTLPQEIVHFNNLTRLDLSSNQLTKLPAEIAQLTDLIELNLSFNSLTTLPAEIAQLSKLKRLNLSINQLIVLPPEISQLTDLLELNLSFNSLATLPAEIAQLSKLTELDLTSNSLPLPPEILENTEEPKTIINYYLQHLAGQTRPLNEAKMLLVGQGGVGKTSLVGRLVEDRFNPREQKTEGIDIRQWEVAVEGHNIRLNMWDFGGQEIMHTTHQFFLTKRSLYLLVLDARLGEEENRLEYWLKIIQSFGGSSPIIIVGNKIDQQPLDLNRRGLQKKHKNIKAIVETSCETGQGIDELKVVIAREVGGLEHVYDEVPNTWFVVKDRLEGMEENYITQKAYRHLCQENDITDPTSQNTLLGFLHDLGIVLNFEDDPRLKDTNILNPLWVTNGVYKILNDRRLYANKGVLELPMLNEILDPQKYPQEMQLFIMEMMRRFELCFHFAGFENQRFLIPDVLPKEESYTGEWQGPLAFQYHYNVLPGSIFSRFIVRMHPYIHKNTCWRTGVLLADGKNIALVKVDKEDRRLFIWIRGPREGRRSFLAIIRLHCNAIHKTIPRIEVDEKVPLPDHPEIVVDYRHLLKLEMIGEMDFIPEGLTEHINIKQLLDGVESEEERIERRVKLREEAKPERQPEPLSEPVEIEDAAALAELEKFKTYLDRKSEKETKCRLGAYVGVLVAFWMGLVILSFIVGPGTMGVWLALIGVVVPLGSYMYFAITQKKLSPEAIYEQLLESRKKKNYREAEFEETRYERLLEE